MTEHFLYRSSRGNDYILVDYHCDGNDILAEPLKNRTVATIKEYWDSSNNKFATVGIQPRTYILDNEASQNLKNSIIGKEIRYQLVPPHIHQEN